MFKKPLLLKATEHAGLTVSDTTDWRFAANEMLVPVVFSEMADIAREYPLVFVKDKPLAYALTGIEQGVNAYVTGDGKWLATYIPAQLRCYPIGLTPVPNKPDEFAIIADAAAPQLASKTGKLLFENGQPSALLQQRLNLLKTLQQAERVTQALVKVIQDAGLLKDQNITVKKTGQQTTQIKGLQIVDEQKLNALPHEAFAKLRDQGVLPLVYAHLLSLANLRQGAIAGKYPQMQKQQEDLMTEMLKKDTISFN
jgi:hypothetical protein